MIKYSSLMLITLLVAGCGLGDPRPVVYPAKIITVNDNVCILVPAEKGEFLVYLDIVGTGKEKPLRKYITASEKPVYISSNQCVPLYGYRFESGRAYGVSVKLQTKGRQACGKSWRAFAVSFTLYRDEKDKLKPKVSY